MKQNRGVYSFVTNAIPKEIPLGTQLLNWKKYAFEIHIKIRLNNYFSFSYRITLFWHGVSYNKKTIVHCKFHYKCSVLNMTSSYILTYLCYSDIHDSLKTRKSIPS